MRRGTILVVLLALAVLGGGIVLYGYIFGDEDQGGRATLPAQPPEAPRPVGTPPPEEPAPAWFDVAEVVGTVEVLRGDAWHPLKQGERVAVTETIRTGADARAVVRAPSGDELTLRSRVELSIDVLSEKVTELTLRRGRVRAAAAAATERFKISSGGAVAQAPGGTKFTVFADPRGAVAVATEAGDVEVIAGGESVSVGKGKQTYVPPGGKPTTPVEIPADVFLSVTWPEREVHAKSAVVRGKARPGAEVLVDGVPVTVEEDGTFTREVPLREGKNRLGVTAEEIGGGVKEARRDVLADTKGPPLEVETVDYGEPQKPKPKPP